MTFDPYEDVRRSLAQAVSTSESVNAQPAIKPVAQPAPVTMGQGQGLKTIQAPWAPVQAVQPVQADPNSFRATLERAMRGSTVDAAKLDSPQFVRERADMQARAAAGEAGAMNGMQFVPSQARLAQTLAITDAKSKARKEEIGLQAGEARKRLERTLAAVGERQDKTIKAQKEIEAARIGSREDVESKRREARKESEQKRLDQAAKFNADRKAESQGRADLQGALGELEQANGRRDRLMKERQNLERTMNNAATNAMTKDVTPGFIETQKAIETNAKAQIDKLDKQLDEIAEMEKVARSKYDQIRGNATTQPTVEDLPDPSKLQAGKTYRISGGRVARWNGTAFEVVQ